MATQFQINGEIIPVPEDVVSQGKTAMQGFYDGQVARLQTEAQPAPAPAPAPTQE